MKPTPLFLLLLFLLPFISGAEEIRFSTAGFYELPGSGRTVESLNPGWRFAKGVHPDASAREYPADSLWKSVNLPNGLELFPVEASGGINYRGEAWYRKYFTVEDYSPDKRYTIHFEGIMGKSAIWVNGTQVAEHYGGFLPVIADISDALIPDPRAVQVISVRADNSDDPLYPPGKPQAELDYCYFGGIYRDAWLVTTGKVYVTDANEEDVEAGGGVFIHTEKVGEDALVRVWVHLRNDTDEDIDGNLLFSLGSIFDQPFRIAAGTKGTLDFFVNVPQARFWSPDDPYLYDCVLQVKDWKGKVLDGFTLRQGLRTIEFNPRQGLILNGKPYPRKLIGANRHQDYAVIGNALSNSLHWRDAVKLKRAGMDVVRNAHYPQDPAFMDACDQLGIFVIENTPGWQFWNDEPVFAERVYDDIRQMVRRDRNRASVLMWEPILNETWYPADFAEKAHRLVHEEYPYPGCYTASDAEARGSEHFDLLFAHPQGPEDTHPREGRVWFTREWGDNVDDWSSHNSTSRVARQWGEVPQLVQARHYASPDYPVTSYDGLMRTPVNHIGGTLWHAFDHQRGYHPDPFYGGIMDAFRRPKYAYELFRMQAPGTEPAVFIAGELTPFSPSAVTVYSNCDSVRLTSFTGTSVLAASDASGLRYPILTFEDGWDFMQDKALSRSGRQKDAYVLAEGFRDGQVVATDRKSMARRASQLVLELDSEGLEMVANGSDLVTVVASIRDQHGQVKRLNNQRVRFTVEGQGELLLPESQRSGVPLLWGEASVLVRSTTTPGTMRIYAEIADGTGDWTPTEAILTIETLPAPEKLNCLPGEIYEKISKIDTPSGLTPKMQQIHRDAQRLREVERQQEAFGE